MRQDRKLTDDQVRDIRNSRSPQARLAEKYGVDRKTVRNIRHGLTYREVPDHPPVDSSVGSMFHGKYQVGDPLELLGRLPVGSAETVLTAPPPYLPVRVGDHEHKKHARYHRYVLEECLRVVGPAGLVMYVHRPIFGKNGEVDMGTEIFQNLPLWQVIVWSSPLSKEPRTGSQQPKGFLQPQNYANILLFARERWRMPERTENHFARFGAVWSWRRPDSSNVPPEFPLELADRCISLGPGPVLDPYAGTGTTAIAAQKAERDWILFDKTGNRRGTFERRLAGLGEQETSLSMDTTRR